MYKEMPVISVNKVVDPKRIIKKMEGRGGGEAQGVTDPKKHGYEISKHSQVRSMNLPFKNYV
jgi:hypothetical protein